MAESYFSRLRRAEVGTHHRIAGPYLQRYAAEMAWREDRRRVANGTQYLIATAAAITSPVSQQWKGYWQRGKNGKKHTINGLIRKRAELAGEIEHEQTVLRQLIIDLDNIDAALRIFKPDIDLDEIKPQPLPPRHAAFKGQVTQAIFKYLREAKGPLTSKQMAEMLMKERGLNTLDNRLVVLITKRVGAALKHYNKREQVRSVKGPDGFLLWEVSH